VYHIHRIFDAAGMGPWDEGSRKSEVLGEIHSFEGGMAPQRLRSRKNLEAPSTWPLQYMGLCGRYMALRGTRVRKVRS
jgi:hypothetical protein